MKTNIAKIAITVLNILYIVLSTLFGALTIMSLHDKAFMTAIVTFILTIIFICLAVLTSVTNNKTNNHE